VNSSRIALSPHASFRPAGGSFEIELALNRAFTSMSYDGRLATEWPGGDRGAPTSDVRLLLLRINDRPLKLHP
jgi:hypothetical protein